MALIRRVSTLLRADLHAVLDALEEPEILLRQAIREMEEILAADRQGYKLLLHEQDRLQTREQEIRQSLNDNENKLDLCFENGQEMLARDLIRRRLEAENSLKALMARRSRLEKRCTELREAIEQNHTRLESTRQQAELCAAEKPQMPTEDYRPAMERQILEREVELELLREKQKRGLS